MKKTTTLALSALVAACSTGAREEATSKGAQALNAGFVPAAGERAARGAAAIAVDSHGTVFVLDSVNGRIARKNGDQLVTLAEVPTDADDLAIGPDGAMAVRRSVKPQILVFDPQGKPAGVVDTSALPDIDGIALARSRRVLVTTPFQETFSLGSPSMPQLAASVLATKREGAALLPDGRGVVAIHTNDGELELRIGSDRIALGRGSAARVIGAEAGVVCLRIENLSTDAEGALRTAREAACVDTGSRKIVFRTNLGPPGPSLPRRELSYAASTLAYAHTADDGRLEVTTWTVKSTEVSR